MWLSIIACRATIGQVGQAAGVLNRFLGEWLKRGVSLQPALSAPYEDVAFSGTYFAYPRLNIDFEARVAAFQTEAAPTVSPRCWAKNLQLRSLAARHKRLRFRGRRFELRAGRRDSCDNRGQQSGDKIDRRQHIEAHRQANVFA